MVGSAIALITTTLASPIHNDFFMPNSFLNRVLLKWITRHAAGDIHQALGPVARCSMAGGIPHEPQRQAGKTIAPPEHCQTNTLPDQKIARLPGELRGVRFASCWKPSG
jgi:hypothetical protein